jgi:hypothetical protein
MTQLDILTVRTASALFSSLGMNGIYLRSRYWSTA